MDNVNQLLRNLPKVDEVLKKFDSCYDRDLLKYVINSILDRYRQKIRNGILKYVDIDKIIEDIKISYSKFVRGSLVKVVNATGIPIHTNLGRSPILYDVYEMSKDIICGYSNLEFDLEEGSRGDRYFHCDQYLRYLTGAESSLVVNNNAAAVFLILNSFAKDREVIVSRGELIEIGGSFRLPDVMTASGAILREVGTTNKTKLSDYYNAINDKTSIIMKSHTSNYKIIGFTESVSLEEIAKLSAQNNLISYYDAGSGAMIDFNFGNCFEKSVKNVVE
ncbi:MAG: L-seryl-tRNA(Sec) selenium transferase, partial [Deferribacterales bacterium]